MRPVRLAVCLSVSAALLPALAGAADLPELSLEELLKTEVTTASRKAQALFDVPAAAFVLSAEDIRRAGATSLPEALRLVPGVEVAQQASGQWAVSVRGANGRFANKLLVLVDGRSIYSPLFSGVFWEMDGLLSEDIERIEVIRGPGAAMWGANAVNGVINVITRRAAQTQGGAVSARAGTTGERGANLRYGFAPGADWHVRAEGALADGTTAIGAGGAGAGERDAGRFTLRADGNTWRGRRTLIANYAEAQVRNSLLRPGFEPPYMTPVLANQRTSAADLLLREERALDNGSEVTLQASVAGGSLKLLDSRYDYRQLDLDAQHRWLLAGGHELVWGGAWRSYRDRMLSAFPLNFGTERVQSHRVSAFAQYDWTIVPDRWRLSLGARIDRETDIDAQTQPNARLLWLPAAGQTFWVSAGQASRLMSRAERDAQVTLAVLPPAPPAVPLPVEIKAQPGPTRPERLIAYEMGYRGELGGQLFADVVLFQHRYRNLRGGTLQSGLFAADPPRLQTVFTTTTVDTATARGLELFIEWRPLRSVRLQAGGNWLRAEDGGARGLDAASVGGNSPQHQFFARLGVDPRPGHALDLIVKRVGSLAIGPTPAYTRLDLRYGLRLGADTELALVGQNLGDRRHPEIQPDFLSTLPVEIERSAYLKLSTRF